ncbi:MAG: Zn-ribbon domain-containing OB-fold protein [Pseudomonadota bacterium]
MKEWLKDVDDLVLKGQIVMPYTWWVGETGSRFLIALRDHKKIMGSRCPDCGKVFVPPRKNCGRCFVDMDEWVELGEEGVVEAHSIVRFAYELQPVKPPFALALIKLDGADVGLLHLVTEDLDRLKNGVRVRAVFKDERSGGILDIESFRIIEPEREAQP